MHGPFALVRSHLAFLRAQFVHARFARGGNRDLGTHKAARLDLARAVRLSALVSCGTELDGFPLFVRLGISARTERVERSGARKGGHE